MARVPSYEQCRTLAVFVVVNFLVTAALASNCCSWICHPDNVPASCTRITGELRVYPEDYLGPHPFAGLNQVTRIDGNLKIVNKYSVASLSGLEGLTYVGGDVHFTSTNLPSLASLGGLTTIGGNLLLNNMNYLRTLTGLEGLTSIGGDLSLTHMNTLSLSGLGNLTSIGGDFYVDDNYAPSLYGLESLSSIGGNVAIKYNDELQSLAGLQSVASIGGDLKIYSNSLSNLAGLEGLMSIGGSVVIGGGSDSSDAICCDSATEGDFVQCWIGRFPGISASIQCIDMCVDPTDWCGFCDSSCEQCTSSDSCTNCLEGTVILVDGLCGCGGNCKTCSGPTKFDCLTCIPGTALLGDGSCGCAGQCSTCNGPTPYSCLTCVLGEVLFPDGHCGCTMPASGVTASASDATCPDSTDGSVSLEISGLAADTYRVIVMSMADDCAMEFTLAVGVDPYAGADTDSDGTPDCYEVFGCADVNACNFNGATEDDGTCEYAEAYRECDGTCMSDADSDDLCDNDDSCPLDSNKSVPGVCGCGVPDIDSDFDGTHDCDDACAQDGGKIEPGACGCGMPDVDSDSDGTLDCDDACAQDSNKIEPGACGCGVPDVDSDSDGTPDCDDACAQDSNKIEPGVCGCGVPDVDSDSDGTPDCDDACAQDNNKIEPDVCGCGVVDVDSDSDGTPDCDDACPHDHPDDPDSDGTCGEAHTVATLPASHDTFTSKGSQHNDDADKNFGANKYMAVSKRRYAFVSFDVPCAPGMHVNSAILHVYPYNVPSAETQTVHYIVPGDIDESMLTWNTQPDGMYTQLGDSYTPIENQWVDLDVAAALREVAVSGDGTCALTIRLMGGDTDKVKYYTKERGVKFEPRLDIDVEQQPVPLQHVQLTQLRATADTMTKKNDATKTFEAVKTISVNKAKHMYAHFSFDMESCAVAAGPTVSLWLRAESVETLVESVLVYVLAAGEGEFSEVGVGVFDYATAEQFTPTLAETFAPIAGEFVHVALGGADEWLVQNCDEVTRTAWVTLLLKGTGSGVTKFLSLNKSGGAFAPLIDIDYSF